MKQAIHFTKRGRGSTKRGRRAGCAEEAVFLELVRTTDMISRCREATDRRTVMTRITVEGLKLLERLDEPMLAAHRKQLSHLGRERLGALAELLLATRSAVS